MASYFRPRVIEVNYDAAHNPINLKMTGETIEGGGRVTNRSINYPLSGADQTNFTNVLNAIKTATGS